MKCLIGLFLLFSMGCGSSNNDSEWEELLYRQKVKYEKKIDQEYEKGIKIGISICKERKKLKYWMILFNQRI